MICWYCGRDIDDLGQDNVSHFSGFPLCEDCGEDKDAQEEVRLAYLTEYNSNRIWGGSWQ